MDLCAASGTADHIILTERRRACMGISGSALDWLSSCICHRRFLVAVAHFVSSSATLPCGLLQSLVIRALRAHLWFFEYLKVKWEVEVPVRQTFRERIIQLEVTFLLL